jgi:hypothetical protein
MEQMVKQKTALLRTYDLPDIHFSEVTGIQGAAKRFSALHTFGKQDLDSLALNLWYQQSKTGSSDKTRRDCWLQVGDIVYVLWGAVIVSRTRVNGKGEPMEQWEFSFEEMRSYRPCPN